MSDLDMMIEIRDAREWEEQNREPEIPKSAIVAGLGYASACLSEAVNDWLAEACDFAEGTPVERKIQSLIDRLDDMQKEIRIIKREVKDL